jgi:hypothetical protein
MWLMVINRPFFSADGAHGLSISSRPDFDLQCGFAGFTDHAALAVDKRAVLLDLI